MRPLQRILLFCAASAAIWLGLCAAVGIIAAEAALHPQRTAVSSNQELEAFALAQRDDAKLTSVSILADDGVVLAGWQIQPNRGNGNAVILFHGQSDNRAGMLGSADLLVRYGYMVVLPDARAHGSSGGKIATYGVDESSDIRAWFQWIRRTQNAECIDGLGDSMGAAQLLESLSRESDFCAVIAESPFANFREAAFDRMGQQIGAGSWAGRFLLRPAVELGFVYARWKYNVDFNRATPDQAEADSKVPVLLIHGLKDDDLPPRHSERIVSMNNGQNPAVVLWEPANAGHCEASSADPTEYERRVIGWFETHRKFNAAFDPR